MSVDLSMFQDENGNISADKIEVIKEAIEKQTSGLAESKNKILAEKKKLQERIKLFEGIDPERAKQLETEYEELQNKISEKDNDATAIKKALETKYTKQIKEYEENLNTYKSKYEQKMIDETLTTELEKIGVTNPIYKKSVKALLKEQIKLQDDTVFLGEEPVDSYIKKWSETEDAKAFITPAENSGGGYKKSGGTLATQKISKNATAKEKTDYITKYGQEAFVNAIKGE